MSNPNNWPKGKKYTKYNVDNALRILMAKEGYLTVLDATDAAYCSLSFRTPLDRDIFLSCVKELEEHGIHGFICSDNNWGWGINGSRYGWKA